MSILKPKRMPATLRRWLSERQHKQSVEHVTLRIDSLQLIIRETYAMGREDERKQHEHDAASI